MSDSSRLETMRREYEDLDRKTSRLLDSNGNTVGSFTYDEGER